jgi:hypothetical protein
LYKYKEETEYKQTDILQTFYTQNINAEYRDSKVLYKVVILPGWVNTKKLHMSGVEPYKIAAVFIHSIIQSQTTTMMIFQWLGLQYSQRKTP